MGRPAAEGPGFLLATLNPDALIGELSHTLRTFDLQGEQLSMATRRDWPGGLAVTYGAGRDRNELGSLDLVLFDPDLRPARGRIVPLSNSPAGVTPPVWTDRGEVLVAWNDTSHRQVLLGRISAPD